MMNVYSFYRIKKNMWMYFVYHGLSCKCVRLTWNSSIVRIISLWSVFNINHMGRILPMASKWLIIILGFLVRFRGYLYEMVQSILRV